MLKTFFFNKKSNAFVCLPVHHRVGWHTFFFIESAKCYDKSGNFGGYGCCFRGNWEFTAPLEEDECQTQS